MKAVRTSRPGDALRRAAFAGLALAISILGTGAGTVLAADDSGFGTGIVPGGSEGSPPAEEPVPPADAVPADPAPADRVPADRVPADPGSQNGSPAAEDPPPGDPAPGDPAPADPGPGGPAPGEPALEDGPPPPNLAGVSLTGEAYVLRGDILAPGDLHLASFPRALTEVAADGTTAFGAFADPGFVGGTAAGEATKGEGGTAAPTAAQCAYPASPPMATEDARSPGQGATLTAVARCFQGAGQAAGYYARDPGPRATGGAAAITIAGAAAAVDATSNTAGATITSSLSTLDHVTIAEVVKIDSLTHGVTVRTNGRPGGAAVETTAIIGEMTIAGVPVGLPSDSLDQLGATLAGLPPVLSPFGVVTFEVVPEQADAAPDGTSAAGRAAQLVVKVDNGRSGIRFAVGFASAQGRTVVTELAGPGAAPGARRPLPPFRTITGEPYLRPARRSGIGGFVGPFTTGAGSRTPRFNVPSRPDSVIPPGGGFPGGLPSAGLNLLPPPPPPQTADGTAAYGGSGPWIALIGGSVIALALARYLAYSTALRPTAA